MQTKFKYSLPKKFKTDWINALRSTHYKQGAGNLRNQDNLTDEVTYCCLGVACDVAGVDLDYVTGEEWIGVGNLHDFDLVPDQLHGEGEENELVETLSSMNDNTCSNNSNHVFSFNEIADWINNNIKGE